MMRHAATATILLLLAAPVSGTVIYIDWTGGGDYTTIQEGIGAGGEGDTLLIAPGTYTGPQNRDIDFGGTNLVLRGTAGRNSTVIDCEQMGRAFYFHSGEDSTSVLEGLTITNGYAGVELYEITKGGAFYCVGSSPTLTNLVFSSNVASSCGGAVHCELGSSPTLTDVTFVSNSAYDGGGMNSGSGSSPTLTNVVFEDNSGASGGAYVSGENCSGRLTNVAFLGNVASRWGGAASLGSFCSDVLTDVEFVGNYGHFGGAISFTGGSSAVVRNATFLNNAGKFSGAIYSRYASPTIENSTFCGNHGQIVGCIWASNSSMTVTRSIIAFSTGYPVTHAWANNYFSVTHCLVFSNEQGDSLCSGMAGQPADNHDNLFVDPQFCDYLNGDLTIRAGSPCLPENNAWDEFIGAHGRGCDALPGTWFVDCDNVSGLEDGSPEHPFDTIEEGINAAGEGETVAVAAGTYTGPQNRDLDFGGTNTALVGITRSHYTTIDCEDAGRAFNLHGGEDASSSVEGFTIVNGYSAGHGGAMVCDGSSPSVTDVRFIGNEAGGGGALYCANASPALSSVVFSGNEAQIAGAMLCDNSSPALSSVVFSGNEAQIAGAMLCDNSSPVCLDVNFFNNHAHVDEGGGLCAMNGSSPSFARVMFVGNTSAGRGGGMCVHGASSPFVSSGTFQANSAAAGGGMWCGDPGTLPFLMTTTFEGNSAFCGGGICCNDASPTITTSVIAFSTMGEAVGWEEPSNPTIFHCCIFGNAGGDSLFGDYHDNIFADPIFCPGELTVREDSPCVAWNNPWDVHIGAYWAGCYAPSPVEGTFYATATSADAVRLRWVVESLPGITGLNIYRSTSPDGPFERLNEVPIPPVSPGEYEDDTVWPETTFWYDLRAILSDGIEEPVGQSPAEVTTEGRLALRLYPASPNPFTGKTSIRVDVPGHSRTATLTVYDLGGRKTTTLLHSIGRGRHRVEWNGRDARGNAVASGVYFLRLEVDGKVQNAKLMVLR
jgi:predicted outer membrane repeat protein